MYNIIAVIVSILVPALVLKKQWSKGTAVWDFFDNNKYEILIFVILAIGLLVRLVGIVEYPAGLNPNEASAGYESYALAEDGMDRNGKTLPVQFISWGSGQNVLYSYITIPFIAVLGLNVLSIRLPMAIIRMCFTDINL